MSLPEWDNLSTFVHDWMKGLQVLADSIAPDPGEDNSMLAFLSLPYAFDCTFYASITTTDVTDDYSGSQPWLISYRVVLMNNSLRIVNQKYVGKNVMDGIDRWGQLTDEEKAIIENEVNTMYSTRNIEVVNNYPELEMVTLGQTYGTISMYPRGHSSDGIQIKFPIKNDGFKIRNTALFGASIAQLPHENGNGYYTPDAWSADYSGIGAQNNYSVYSKIIAVFDNQTEALRVVDTISPYNTNNDVINYTKDGSEYKLYYGDNYLIYALDENKIYNYQDLFTGTNQATTAISGWHPTDPPIKTPTYDEVKHEDEPSELVSDNQEDGGNYNHAEFTKVYACTSAELNDLYQWMGGGAAGSSGTSPVTVPDSFDPMNRIVGLIGYPMVIDVGVGDQTTFTFRNAANQTINTGWSTYKYGNFDREFDFGTVTIPNWEELENGAPFLDYSATVEIYIPFCGVVGLDPQAVMGCTLSCKMWIDFVTGDCSAVVYTNYGGEGSQHPVAFVSGNCGSAEVVSANAFGSYQGAKAQASHKMSQAILGGFKDLATSVIGGATTGFTRGAANPSGTGGNAGMRAGAIGSVIGGAMNLGVNLTLQNMDNRYAVQVAKNALGTTISGSFGQQTSWYYMDTPYIKVTWPTPISKDIELYGKTFGVPVHRSGALSEFTGYTVCNNVDVSGIAGATASELAIIKQFLETGVFIKEGGGE